MASRKPNEQTHLDAQGWGRGEQRSSAKVRDFEGFRKNWMVGCGSPTPGAGDRRLQGKVIGLGGQVPRIASADPGHKGVKLGVGQKGLSWELARRE